MPKMRNRLQSLKGSIQSDMRALGDVAMDKINSLKSRPPAAARSAEQGKRELEKPVTKMKAKEGPSKKIELLSRRNQDSALRKLEE
jgi:hypothetical protein